MGIVSSCSNTEVRRQMSENRRIDYELKQEASEAKKKVKLLLLGPAESGKSTVVKQMRILHTRGFQPYEVAYMREVIRSNVVRTMVVLIKAMRQMNFSLVGPLATSKDIALVQKSNEEDSPKGILTQAVAESLCRLWGDQGIQATYARRNEFQIMDSTKYFMEAVATLSDEDYHPTIEDMLRARVATTGIVNTDFIYLGKKISIFDVGGQRSERRKWIHVFDNCDAIIFVAAISDFDQTLAENQVTNRMLESLGLFENIANGPWFSSTCMILFLNKIDLFEEKIRSGATIKSCFLNYQDDPRDVMLARKHICKEFLKRNNNKERPVFRHYTCATDTQQISKIVVSAMNAILRKTFATTGLS